MTVLKYVIPMETALATNQLNDSENVNIYTKGKQVNISTSRNIKSVVVFDLLGRTVYESDTIDTREFKTPVLNFTNQVLIVKVKCDNNTTTTRKIILN